MKFLGGVGIGLQGPMSSILVTIRITIRIQESEIWIHWIIELPMALMKFYGELRYGLQTN